MKIKIYWDVTSCWLLITERDFGEGYCLHLQDNLKDFYCDTKRENRQNPRSEMGAHIYRRVNNSPAPSSVSCNPFMKLLLAVIPNVTIHRPSGIHKSPCFVSYPFTTSNWIAFNGNNWAIAFIVWVSPFMAWCNCNSSTPSVWTSHTVTLSGRNKHREFHG